jgi:heme-degrading monooxygenase HmoA
MIARVWKGWTKAADADDYEKLLRRAVHPELKTIEGNIGGYILRHDNNEGSEFVTMNLFESIDAVKKKLQVLIMMYLTIAYSRRHENSGFT